MREREAQIKQKKDADVPLTNHTEIAAQQSNVKVPDKLASYI